MAVTATDLNFRYSGGSSNDIAGYSLGGVMSSEEVPSSIKSALFEEVDLDESEAGSTKYRCFYVINTHATDSLALTTLFIASNTPASSTHVAMGLDPAGIGDGSSTGVATTISPETDAPAGVSFSDYPTSGAGLSIGTLDAGEAIAVWLRRVIDAGSPTPLADPFTVRVTGVPI